MRILILKVLLHHCHISSSQLSFLDRLHALVSTWLADLITATLSVSEEFEMTRLNVILHHWLLNLVHGLIIDEAWNLVLVRLIL